MFVLEFRLTKTSTAALRVYVMVVANSCNETPPAGWRPCDYTRAVKRRGARVSATQGKVHEARNHATKRTVGKTASATPDKPTKRVR